MIMLLEIISMACLLFLGGFGTFREDSPFVAITTSTGMMVYVEELYSLFQFNMIPALRAGLA